MKDNHPYLVNIDLMIQVNIPADIDPHSEDGMAYIRAAVGEQIANNKAFEWLMENIGEIRPSQQPQQVFRSKVTNIAWDERVGNDVVEHDNANEPCEAPDEEAVEMMKKGYTVVIGGYYYTATLPKAGRDTPEEIATEREAYREGQIAWVSHEAGNTVANTYPKGSPQHTAWNRGFNVGA